MSDNPNMQADFSSRTGSEVVRFGVCGKLLMLLFNYWAFAQIVISVVIVTAVDAPFIFRFLFAVGFFYLFPPFAAMVIRKLFPFESQHYAYGSKQFMVWWALFNLQVLFLRLPMLEEALRILPGCYSVWLRLWGAKIGRLTYWAPGTVILDRSFLRIGDDVIFGAGVRLNPHVIDQAEGGGRELLLAPVEIGDRVVVGGYSLLTAGTRLQRDQILRAFTVTPPFSHWEGGKRVRSGNGVQ